MRESIRRPARAARRHARVWSEAGAGTEVELCVPRAPSSPPRQTPDLTGPPHRPTPDRTRDRHRPTPDRTPPRPTPGATSDRHDPRPRRLPRDHAIRVFLVDDHRLFRAGVRAELGQHVTIVGDAGDVDAAIQGIRATKPDVVLLDVHMPGGGGLARARGGPRDPPDVRFLALSVSDAAEDVIQVIRAGARGYVTKTISPDDLVDAIGGCTRATRCSARGWPGSCSTRSRRAAGGHVERGPELDQLTTREKEVLRHIARGYTYREVASRLHISVKTVETHVSAVLRKLQLSNRHELTAWAAHAAPGLGVGAVGLGGVQPERGPHRVGRDDEVDDPEPVEPAQQRRLARRRRSHGDQQGGSTQVQLGQRSSPPGARPRAPSTAGGP
jgi:DNA-binding NarL/FixJ family response regulator